MTAILIIWGVCSFLAYGTMFGTLQGSWPTLAEKNYITDIIISMAIGILGPFGLLGVVITTTFTVPTKLNFKLW